MNDRFRFRIPMYSEYEERFAQFIYTDVYHEPLGFIGAAIFKTPEQCTGLKDKNGRLIYEGDIVRGPLDEPDGEFGKITWDDIDACWGINYSDVRIDFGYVWADKFEVVGNIHENPELLEDK